MPKEMSTRALSRRVARCDIKAVVTAAHYGRLHRTASQQIIEKIPGRGGGNNNMRRDAWARAAEEQGYIELTSTWEYRATAAGIAEFRLTPRNTEKGEPSTS